MFGMGFRYFWFVIWSLVVWIVPICTEFRCMGFGFGVRVGRAGMRGVSLFPEVGFKAFLWCAETLD